MRKILVIILLIQLTVQPVFLLGAASAAAADNPTVNQESPSQGDFLVYADLMRRAKNDTDKVKVRSELKIFLQAEKVRLKDLHVPYSRQWRYFALLEKQLDSLDITPPSKIESTITAIRSWLSLNQDQTKPEDTIKQPDQPSEFAFAPDNVRLTAANLGQAFVPVVPSAKNWWQRLWQKIRDLFGINSAQAQSSNYLPTVADIQPDNAEIIVNSDINDLAAELNYNPVKIFNYVRANITYEPYYGAKKGSLGCLKEKVCNDVDTTSLAIALLRASGIPARYHKALAVAPVGALKEMLGVDEVKTVYFALATNKIPVSLVGGSNPSIGGTLDAANLENETQLAVEWTVPELFYDYDERGANIDNTVNLETLATATTTPALQNYLAAYPKKQWIPLEVLIKNPLTHTKKEIVTDTAGFDSQAFWYGFLQYQGGLSPMNKYRGDLLSATGKDVFTVNYQSTKIRPTVPNFDILPATLPYQFTVGTDNTGASITDERWPQLPDSRREQVIITLKKSSDSTSVLTHSFFASEINNVPVSLVYNGATQIDKDVIASYGGIAATPASLVAITPSLTLAGANYTTASTLAIGDSLILDFQYQVKGQTISQNQKFSISGNEEGIYVMMSRLTSDANLDDPALDAAQRASRILIQGNAALAREYLKHWQEQNDLLKKSLDYEYQTQFSRAVVTQNRILTPVGNTPTTFDFKGLSIDAAVYVSDYSNRGNYKTHRQDFRLLSSLEASYYEAGLFQDIAGLDAVSTVTGLQYAYANPGTYNVQIITATNESVIDSLNLTANTKANLHADVQSGKTIVTPDKFVTKGVWAGILYISLAPDWTGRYAIGEQVQNGGWTTSGLLLQAYTNQNSQQRDGWLYQFGSKRFYYEDTVVDSVQCSITEAEYNAVISRPDWLNSFGHPCAIGSTVFGLAGIAASQKQHAYILASNGAYFQSSGQYDYWAYRSDIVSKLKQYINSLPGVDDIYNLRFSLPLGTYAQSICTEEGWFNCNNSKYATVYYTPYQSGSIRGRVYQIKEGFLNKVSKNDNGLIKVLGFPQSDEQAAGTSPAGTQGKYQDFFNGQLYYYSKWTLDHIYFTHSKLTDIHNSNSGTNGVLGFPASDPILRNGYIYQQFEDDKEVSWNLTNNALSIVAFKKYRCELYGNIHNPARLGIITSHGILDTVINNVADGLGLLGSVTRALFSPGQTLKDGAELVAEAQKIKVNDVKNFLRSAGKAVYTALIDEYDTSFGPNGCEARSNYLLGRLTGEVLLILVPASELKVTAKVKILNKTIKGVEALEKVLPDLKFISKIGRFGKSALFTKADDIAELQALRSAVSELKGAAGEAFWRRITGTAGRDFDTPNLGKRIVDAYDRERGYAYEIKNFASRNVRLTDSNIQNEIAKDVHLMNNFENYNPVWVFLDKGPNEALEKELQNKGIAYILLSQ